MKCLEIKNLDIAYGKKQIIFGFDFELDECQIGCLLGPSGCGKTTVLRSIAGFEQPSRGEISLNGKKLSGFKTHVDPEKRHIGMVFQDIALFPHLSVEENIQFGMRSWSREKRKKRSQELLDLIGMLQFMKKYPHQLSGGQRQRVMIAMALLCNPKVLIADEPTTALDVTIQAQILELMKGLQERHGTAILLITHDLGVVAGMSDRVNVMYAGRLVESASTAPLFDAPCHPYTIGLLGSVPDLTGPAGDDLYSIPGQPPDLAELPTGCAFAPRCSRAADACSEGVPATIEPTPGRLSACLEAEALAELPRLADLEGLEALWLEDRHGPLGNHLCSMSSSAPFPPPPRLRLEAGRLPPLVPLSPPCGGRASVRGERRRRRQRRPREDEALRGPRTVTVSVQLCSPK